MNTALTIIGLAMFIFIIVFSLKRAKERRKAQQEEHEKIKEYGESINEETRNKNKWKKYGQKKPLLKSLLFGVKDSSKVVVWVETEEIDL